MALRRRLARAKSVLLRVVPAALILGGATPGASGQEAGCARSMALSGWCFLGERGRAWGPVLIRGEPGVQDRPGGTLSGRDTLTIGAECS